MIEHRFDGEDRASASAMLQPSGRSHHGWSQAPRARFGDGLEPVRSLCVVSSAAFRAASLLILCLVAGSCLRAQTSSSLPPIDSGVSGAIGVSKPLAELAGLERRGEGDSDAALRLRNAIMLRVMLASFDVDQTLARIDAEQAHVSESRAVLEAQKQHRDTELNIAAFAVGGALGSVGSAMELSAGLNRAGNAVSLAGAASALSISIVQLRLRGGTRLLLSPYNMLAEVLGEPPNAQSRYPAVVETYLHAPAAEDGLLPDRSPPEVSLRTAWVRLHRLQGAGSAKGDNGGATVASVTTSPASGLKLTSVELADREAMLRDLHGTVALLKTDLRDILLRLSVGNPDAGNAP